MSELEIEDMDGLDSDEEFDQDLDFEQGEELDQQEDTSHNVPQPTSANINNQASADGGSEGVEDVSDLDNLIFRIAEYSSSNKLSPADLRHNLFEDKLRSLSEQNSVVFDDLIISSSQEDVAYNKMIAGLYPALEKYLAQVINESNRPTLISLLTQALDELLPMAEVEDAPEETGVTASKEEQDDEEYEDPDIQSCTARVMNVYKDLFEVGFELVVPFGLLLKDGVLRLHKGKTNVKQNSSFANLYTLINDLSGKRLVQSEVSQDVAAKDLRAIKMRKGTTYYPEFQLGNLYGILADKRADSWEELNRLVRPEVHSNIKSNFEAGKDIQQIAEALTTCIVISEFDVNSAMRIRFNIGNAKFDRQTFEREYQNRKNTIFYGNGAIYHCQILPSGVVELILVFSEAAFNGKPLFAYEAVLNLLKRNKKPSIKSVILGQDTSGKILTKNLDTQESSIILIGAGQRSGKGVFTLNLLGTILSEGCPLVYADAKPDIAPVLWSLGKKHGIGTAVWDVFQSNSNKIGHGAPERMVIENPGIFGILMYLKVLQIMMVAASLQAKGVKLLNGKRPFFIFDEALAVQMTLSSNWARVIKTATDKNADPEEKAWCMSVVEWVESLDSDLPAVINSQLPKSGVSTVWLFQAMQPSTWTPYQVQGLGSRKLNVLKHPITSRSSVKFLGRGTADSEYALGSLDIKKDQVIQTRVLSEGGRHFAMTGSQKVTSMKTVSVFKPYLVLNESEDGTDSAEELKAVLSREVLAVVAPDGSLDPRTGFEGFARMLGDDAIRNLSLGRAYIEAVLSHVGVMQNYSTIEEYLYDASIESFKALGSIVSGSSSPDMSDSMYTSTSLSDDEESALDQGEQSIGADPAWDQTSSESQSIQDSFEGEPIDNVEHDNEMYKSPNAEMHYDNIYSPEMDLQTNPFTALGRGNKPLSAINAINVMSDLLMKQILSVVGDYSRITSFEVTMTGLVINNVAFRPQFKPEVVETMPYDMRGQVLRGNVIELFHFGNIKKFRNLTSLRIDNARLAEGRVRRELGLHPSKSWYDLMDRFRSLQEIIIGGTVIRDEPTAQSYDNNGRGGYTLTETLREKLGVPLSAISNSHMEAVWHSRPVRVFGKALGWTAGVKVVSLAAMMFGPWGLLFGALAGYGAYRELQKRSSRDRR